MTKHIQELVDSAHRGDVNAIRTLVGDNGANINGIGRGGWTPLARAVTSQRLEAVRELLRLKASPDHRDSAGSTLLHYAAIGGDDPQLINTAIINVLADAGAEIDAKDNSGNTPLHKAVLSLNESAARALLDRGASPTLRNHDGKTAGDIAREQQCRPIQRLIEKATDTARGR